MGAGQRRVTGTDFRTPMTSLTMIGDDVEFDAAGALRAGCGAGVLVRTGKYRPGDEDRVQPRPTLVAADLPAAIDRLLRDQ